MRIVVLGNSGSGKTSYARWLADRERLLHLDLDSIVWEPGKVAVQRPMTAIETELEAFMDEQPRWVIEGCYGELVAQVLPRCSRLVFLNPGLEVCLQHNGSRPWEPDKYATAELQDSMLASLQSWVGSYYERSDAWSYAMHRRLFDTFGGEKVEHREPLLLADSTALAL